MKLAVVVQRYGADINGGAELHARYLAEHLARNAEVDVLTTCARDYVTWRNEIEPGDSRINGILVRRFRVDRERDPDDFGRRSRRVFTEAHSLADELAWLEREGPASSTLVRHLRASRDRYDYFIFFSYRYYHAYHGARAVPSRAVLVPTAERDDAMGLALFPPLFRGVRALMYNSLEERALIRAASGNHHVPGVVVGIGSDLPERPDPARFRQQFGLPDRFALYIGRIDANKGCGELFEFFQRYARRAAGGLTLALAGTSILPIPTHPRIRYLGFLDDRDKFDALAAADLLIMPSYYESLSMVVLEAWGLGRPVLVNGRCDVLKGQCLRSHAGLYYDGYAEFAETLRSLESNPGLAVALGQNGRDFFRRHYTWPTIEGKYLAMFDQLTREVAAGAARRTLEPLPGWWRRRVRDEPPAEQRLADLPAGPVVGREE